MWIETKTRLRILLLLCLAALMGHADDREISFNRDVRPIFADTCFRCHGPDQNARKAGLRLDLREEALKKTKSGVTPIVPGKPGESEVVRRIFSQEKYEVMPPEEAHKVLTASQKETIKRWIAEGANYEGHWAYQPVVRPTAPDPGARHPIDAFIREKLKKAGFAPAAEADRRTLIRRVSLDLTGIPPTPQEVAAFVADKSPNAYEKLVDRLLDSPRYAEKQAMHWLDAVRYADTSGFHGDNLWPAWPYRDYVLRAFRDNKPFDQFTIEQLAGDLLPNATTEQKVASAFNRLNRVSAEGGLQPREYLAKYAADRVRTTSVVWMGATLGCAECHDHKFDPYQSRDFYSLKAFFADIKETGLVPDRGRNSFGSKLSLPSEEQKKKFDVLTAKMQWAETELEEAARKLKGRFESWQQETLAAYKADAMAWKIQRPIAAEATNGAKLRIYNDEKLTVTQYRGGNLYTEEIVGDGLVVAGGENPDNASYTVRFKPGAGEWGSLGIEIVQDESLSGARFSRGGDRFVLTEVELERESGRAGERAKQAVPGKNISFVLATTDRFGEQMENHAMNAIDGNSRTGWGAAFGDGRSAFLSLRFSEKLATDADTVLSIRLRQDSELRKATIGRFRLALSRSAFAFPDHQIKTPRPLRGLQSEVATALQAEPEKRTEPQSEALWNLFKRSQPELIPIAARIARLDAERDLVEADIPRVMIAESVAPAETRILARGNFLDESGMVVMPAIPAVFGKVGGSGDRATRLDLARWIVSRNNPLTARVFVNRIWRQFFGIGLSKSLDDLGSQGEWPTHPELLDWLASEFMHPANGCDMQKADCGLHDWDVKHLIRTIVTSDTYKQASGTPDERDPDNRLLARQNRFRVDAEIVHDIALGVSGLLVEKFGGPSVRPYQPEGYLLALNFPKRDYSAGRGEDLYRRGLYTQWQRTFLHPSLMTFDAPSREECTVNRVNSNTPLQSLVLLNDPIYVEAARVFAQNSLKQGGATPASQIGWAFERALGRSPNAEERRVLADLYAKSLKQFERDPAAAREVLQAGEAPAAGAVAVNRLAAMTTVTRAILNLHETITRN